MLDHERGEVVLKYSMLSEEELEAECMNVQEMIDSFDPSDQFHQQAVIRKQILQQEIAKRYPEPPPEPAEESSESAENAGENQQPVGEVGQPPA